MIDCNHTVCITDKSRPIKWQSIYRWLRSNTKSCYTEFTVGPSLYQVTFDDPNEALIFKLTWS